jgi:hypothetical protein
MCYHLTFLMIRRARLDSSKATLSVIVQSAQAIKPSLLQIADISFFGTPREAASLLLPRGSLLLSDPEAESVDQKSKETPLGEVDIPPVNYYRYEFTTASRQGSPQSAYISVAANRGRLYVASLTSPLANEEWTAVKAAGGEAAIRSFRLKIGSSLGPRG